MKILVDTCIWSAAFRRNSNQQPAEAVELQNLILDNRVQMIGPIRQELLSGIKQDTQFKKLESLLRSFPDVPIITDDYVLAAKFFNQCRAKGIQGSSIDFLICAVAVNHKLPIYTTDQDFIHYLKCIPITLHAPESF